MIFQDSPLSVFEPYLITLIGFIFGSFFGVLYTRLPHDKNIAWPGSSCDACAKKLSWYHNIPILSFMFLRGKCGSCGVRIPSILFLLELMTGLVFWIVWCAAGTGPELLTGLLMVSFLLPLSFIDWTHFILPNSLTLSGAVVGIAVSWLPGGVGLGSSVMGALLGVGILWGIALFYEKYRGIQGMGGGDIKLMGLLGAFLGPFALSPILFISCCVAVLYAGLRYLITKKGIKSPIPFGPFLSLSAFIIYLMDAFEFPAIEMLLF